MRQVSQPAACPLTIKEFNSLDTDQRKTFLQNISTSPALTQILDYLYQNVPSFEPYDTMDVEEEGEEEED